MLSKLAGVLLLVSTLGRTSSVMHMHAPVVIFVLRMRCKRTARAAVQCITAKQREQGFLFLFALFSRFALVHSTLVDMYFLAVTGRLAHPTSPAF